jgi:hypothetical protein
LKYFQLIPKASPVSDGIANLPFQLNLMLTAQASLTPSPPFHALMGFCLLGGHGGGDPLNPQVGSFITFEQSISNNTILLLS